MACSIEYRKYMDECLRAAARAASEDEPRSHELTRSRDEGEQILTLRVSPVRGL